MSDEKKMVKDDHHIKKHRAMVFLSSVLAVLFLSVSSILAYEYYLEKIERCSVSDGGICFDLEEVGIQDKATIKNLKDDKKYRIVIKKKISDDKSIEIGSVEVNTSEEEKAALRIDCTDTDGGENYYIKGTASSPSDNSAQEDTCSASQLTEGVCKQGSDGQMYVAKLNYTCPNGCENGVCKQAGTISEDTSNYCESYVYGDDEVDYRVSYAGDKVSFEEGYYVNSGAGNGLIFKSDTVSEISVFDLLGPDSQYGCGGKIKSVWFYNGLVNVGDNTWLRYDWSSPLTWLNDLTVLKEGLVYSIIADSPCVLSAPNNVKFWKSEACEGDCINGICEVSSATCADTDGGKDYYTAGETRYNNVIAKDQCGESDMLVENFCENGLANKTEVQCGITGCENGACKIGFLGDKCIDDNGCTMDLECKRSGRYPGDVNDPSVYSERYCCVPNNCASVIPGPGEIDFNTAIAPHCVATGGTDQAMDGTILTCNNGSY